MTRAGFLESLDHREKKLIEHDLKLSFDELEMVLENVDHSRISEWTDMAKCLIHGSFHRPEIMWIKRASGYDPVGVDWEGSKIGVPGEDLRIGADLLAEGDVKSFDALFSAYLDIMKKNGVTISRNELITSARRENLTFLMRLKIPWLFRQYLNVHQDVKFDSWSQFIRENVPNELRFMKSEIEGDLLYRKISD